MGFPLFTTPTLTLTFTEEGLDLTQALGVFVTLRSGSVTITKESEDLDIDEKTIGVFLSQEETGRFDANFGVEVQANWITADGRRVASTIVRVRVDRQLLDHVIEAG